MTAMDSEAPVQRSAPQTAGAWLRETRSARGIHIAALAAMLKVPQAKLEALESDRYQDLPDATFVRALAKAMCRALKADPAPVLALLPKGQELELDRVSKGLNQPFRERATRGDVPALELLKHPAAIGALLLLLGAAAVYLLPQHWIGRGSEPVATAPVNDAPVMADAASAANTTLPAASAVLESAPAVAQLDPASAPSPAAPVTHREPLAQSGAQSAQPPSRPTVAAETRPGAELAGVRLRALADTWVELVDARGQVLLSRLLRGGELAELQAQAPLKLRVGNVAGTELLLRGEKVDLAAVARDNVARLELQ